MTSPVTEPAPRREVIGLVFRGMRAELERRGLTERVLAHLQGEARRALEPPPGHATWLPGPVYDALMLAIARESNRQTLRDLGLAVVRGTTAPMVLPLIKTFLNLFGATPLSLLNNLTRLTALLMRGISTTYEAQAPRSGVLTVTHVDPVDPLLFAVWEGVLLFGKDLFGYPMVVETAVPLSDGRSAKIRVSW